MLLFIAETVAAQNSCFPCSQDLKGDAIRKWLLPPFSRMKLPDLRDPQQLWVTNS